MKRKLQVPAVAGRRRGTVMERTRLARPPLKPNTTTRFRTRAASAQRATRLAVVARTAVSLLVWGGAAPLGAQTVSPPLSPPKPAFEVFPRYETSEAIAEQLRRQPPKLYEFDRASLRDTLRFLADDAGIPFVALPESSDFEATLVTFTMRTSPFRALEIVAKANGVALFYENGVWYMRPFNDQELVGRTYKLKYFPQDEITYEPTGSGSGTGSGTGTSGTGATGAGGATGGAGIADISLNLEAGRDVFQKEPPEVIEEIKEMLGIPTSGFDATIGPEATVDDNFPFAASPNRIEPRGAAPGAEGEIDTGEDGARVIYNSDTDTIFVIATRQQHQWVEGLLDSIDRPQPLVGIEVKFVETRRDPTKELGIDWSETMGEGGYGIQLSDLSATANLERILDPTGLLPLTGTTAYTATLSADDIRVRLQAFLQDRDTSLVQYPRVLTLNNREVVIRSVVNQPVLASTSSVTPGIGGTTTASVAYLPIGTIVNILPKIMPDNSVVMNVAVTISNILSFEEILGEPYPIASSRVYNAALQVNSGYTLAIGGLEEAFDETRLNGIPFLRDIPLVGALFRSRAERRDRKNLLLFITPTTIRNRATTAGLPEHPISTVPIRPDDPTPPAFTPDGDLAGGVGSLDNALKWLDRQVRFFENIINENRTDRATLRHIRSVSTTAVMVLGEIQKFKATHPGMALQLEDDEAYLDDIIRDLNRVLSRARGNRMEFD